jgi:hypothetical protein
MLIQVRNILPIAILGALIVPSRVLSQQPPSPSQPPENSEQRSPAEHKTSNNAEYPSSQTPFILDFLSASGLQKISAYCANKPDKDPDKWLHEQFICDVHITDVAIAIFTGLLVLVTIPLTLVGLCQSRIASKTAKRQLRAYVFISDSEISDIMSDQKLTAKIVVKNFGQTPAYNVDASIGAATGPFPLINELPPAVTNTKNINIGPGGGITLNYDGDGPAAIEWRPHFTQKIGAVYVYGTIKYRDAFRAKRFTDFRLYKGGDAGISGPKLYFSTDDNKAN